MHAERLLGDGTLTHRDAIPIVEAASSKALRSVQPRRPEYRICMLPRYGSAFGAPRGRRRRAMSMKVRRVVVIAMFAVAALVPASAAGAAPSENGCNGLLNAGFATFANVGDTHGHETVHHQQDAHGCHHG